MPGYSWDHKQVVDKMYALYQTAYSVESARDNSSGQASTVTTKITNATSSLVSTVTMAASREVSKTNVTTVLLGMAATPSMDCHGMLIFQVWQFVIL